jgi:hypothetical protein
MKKNETETRKELERVSDEMKLNSSREAGGDLAEEVKYNVSKLETELQKNMTEPIINNTINVTVPAENASEPTILNNTINVTVPGENVSVPLINSTELEVANEPHNSTVVPKLEPNITE